MQQFKLKDSIHLRNDGPQGIMALDIEVDQLFYFQGDIANLVNFLSDKSSRGKQTSKAEIIRELTKVSRNFAKLKDKEETIDEAIEYLSENGFFEVNEK